MGKDSLHTEEMLESPDDFTAAYESHARPIYRFLYWRTRDAALSEDLTSGVFEKAWRSRRSFKGGSVQAWLYRIARNLLTDHWRRKQDVLSDNIDAFPEAAVEDTAGLEMDRSLAVRQLQQALAVLPREMRSVVQLRFIERLPAKQVARRLGLSESNVRVIQYRALRKLRSSLE
jgi:RNA polymerase sigma-70 factor, ECF subfamily